MPYPRFDPRDASRIPADTWQCAQIPAGVRLELVGDASARSSSTTPPPPTTSATVARARARRSRCGAARRAARRAAAGAGRRHGDPRRRAARPTSPPWSTSPRACAPRSWRCARWEGPSSPPRPGPRWVAYGDSILEGWVASAPARAWGAVAARRHGLDLVNLGYAGSARGEIPCAEAVAGLAADVISISHGTNCWTRTPAQRRHDARDHPGLPRHRAPGPPRHARSWWRARCSAPTPRPPPTAWAPRSADLRGAMEEAVRARIDAGDDNIVLVPGAEVITAADLADGIHPGDAGPRPPGRGLRRRGGSPRRGARRGRGRADGRAERWPGRRRWNGW